MLSHNFLQAGSVLKIKKAFIEMSLPPERTTLKTHVHMKNLKATKIMKIRSLSVTWAFSGRVWITSVNYLLGLNKDISVSWTQHKFTYQFLSYRYGSCIWHTEIWQIVQESKQKNLIFFRSKHTWSQWRLTKEKRLITLGANDPCGYCNICIMRWMKFVY